MRQRSCRRLRTYGMLAGAVCFLISSSAHAGVLTYELSIAFSGEPPVGLPPWLTATFDDGGTPGSVDLYLEATNLTTNLPENEAVSVWLFNLDPALNPNDLIFSPPTIMGNFGDPNINLGVNAFRANGDGFFDIEVKFDMFDGPTTRFGEGDAVSYTITGIPSLTADSFNFLSHEDGGQGTYPTAAHVVGIDPGIQSGWVSIPEPGSLSLLALGALLVARRRRR